MSQLFNLPVYFNFHVALVSAHDTALAHIKALEKINTTRGKRYIISENTYYMREVIEFLKMEFSQYGYCFFKIPLPIKLLQLAAYIDSSAMAIIDKPFEKLYYDTSRSRNDLEINY